MKCIFCEEELTDRTKPEHVLLACLGGRKSTRRVDCSKHNEAFGSTIDDEIASQVRVIRNLLELESGTGNLAPGLQNIKAGNETFNFDNEGNPTLVGAKPFTVTKLPDGSTNIQVMATSVDHLNKLIPNIAAAAKLPEDEVRRLLKGSKPTFVSRRPGTVHHSLSFGGPEALRSVAKSALVLWTLAAGNEEVRSDAYAEARQFVLSGGDFNARRMKLDSRPIPGTDALVDRFGKFFNLLYVASDANGRVVGHFTLYNMVGWQMVLAERGGPPNLKIGLINNPLEPKDWSDTIADENVVPFDWLNNPTYVDDFVRARQRVTNMLEKHVEDARSEEWERIIRQVFEKHGIVKGSAVTDPTIISQIYGEAAHRIAMHAHNIPYSEELTLEQIERMMAGK